MSHERIIATALSIRPEQVAATVALLDSGNTIPFIARYRKEATGTLDEEQLLHIAQQIERLRALDERRASILASIEEQGKLSTELRASIEAAVTMTALEDLYAPYRPRRRTRAAHWLRCGDSRRGAMHGHHPWSCARTRPRRRKPPMAIGATHRAARAPAWVPR